MLHHIKCYTDGGAHPNPGKGGWGVVLICEQLKYRKELSGGFELTTNNRMELTAAIKSLETLKSDLIGSVELFSDSAYVVNAFNKNWIDGWKKSNWKNGTLMNIDLWKRLIPLAQQFNVKFIWVKAHNGQPDNERADQLTWEGREKESLVDVEYLNTKTQTNMDFTDRSPE